MIFPPSLVFLLMAAAAIVIELLKPLPIAPANLIRIVVGPVLMALGAALWLLAWREFRRHGEVFGHQYATETVVTTGPYRISRHPAYLGYAVIMAGAGLLIDCGWMLLLVPVAVLIVDSAALREEAYLMAKHENDYRPYRSEVRRWI
ncbi:isoprenylcysteine carboxylmethyltransferase family protein [Emcibacter sp. SYSU 3D8]|uniref:methyltransferase family protein n=1 Tax=Emcibacter sp. SYSU 3D8 TaxID=3133969 RepID=UPI0031FEB3FD